MCYDISFTVKIERIADYFPDLVFDDQLILDYESSSHIQGSAIFPQHPIVYSHKDDHKLHCRMMSWSCVEFYNKTMPDMKKRNGMLNIRSERVLGDEKSYWFKIKSKRCLVPVSAIFEHREVKGLTKKVPYHVKPKGNELFFLPGLYSVAELADKETGEIFKYWTFALMTRDANGVMRQIHNGGDNASRMPLFLPLHLAMEFIDPNLSIERYADILNYKIPSTDLEYYTVNSIRTSKLREDGKDKHEFYEWGEKVSKIEEVE